MIEPMPHKDPEARRAYHRNYDMKWLNKKSPEYRKERCRKANKQARTTGQYPCKGWREIGMTRTKYEQIMSEQGGRCALCDSTQNTKYHKRLAVDHCHSSGKIRGLLCNRCNTSIERAEIPGWLDRAREYLILEGEA